MISEVQSAAKIIGLGVAIVCASCSFKTRSTITLDQVYLVNRTGAPFYGYAVKEGYLPPNALGIQIHSSSQNTEEHYAQVHFCKEAFDPAHLGVRQVLKLSPGGRNQVEQGSEALVLVEITTTQNPKMEQYDLHVVKDDLCLKTYQAATTDVSNEIRIPRDLVVAALKGAVHHLPQNL